ncbi:MAG TPA: EamA family transporter [Kofleriaceae bacterium]
MENREAKLLASLAAVYIIWGSTYLAMRYAVAEIPPFLVSAGRYSLAGAVLFAVGVRRGKVWPSARAWRRAAPVGVFLFVGGNGLVGIAEQSVPSGGAAVVCATMPLWVGLMTSLRRGSEAPTRREWGTLVLGFIGVVVLMGGPSLAGKPIHVVAILAAPICWGFGSLLARNAKTEPGDPLLAPALQMLTGGAACMVAALLHGDSFRIHASSHAWTAFAYLFVAGSLVGVTAYNYLLRTARPVVATSYAFVNPILAVLIGAALSHEPLGWTTVVANVLIVVAVMLALTKRRQSGAK